MNRRDGSDFQTAVLDSGIQKGLVLVVVGVHFACIKREVRAHVVGKLNDFDFKAVLCGKVYGHFCDFRMRP